MIAMIRRMLRHCRHMHVGGAENFLIKNNRDAAYCERKNKTFNIKTGAKG